MGYYVNPPTESKEDFLKREATEISRETFLAITFPNASGVVPLVLVLNPAFSACVIAYSKAEAEYFADQEDVRPKKFFLIEHSKLEAIGTVYPH